MPFFLGLIGLFARYQLQKDIELSLNIENLPDKSYYSSLMWDQAFYGSLRSYLAAVS